MNYVSKQIIQNDSIIDNILRCLQKISLVKNPIVNLKIGYWSMHFM